MTKIARPRTRFAIAALCSSLLVNVAGSTEIKAETSAAEAAPKVVQLPIRTDGPKSLDPVKGSTTYDNMACVQFYETLLVNKYTDPTAMEPLLLEEMPVSDDGGLTWKFKLKEAYFHDNDCFPGGKGRAVRADDVFYSIKRLADDKYELENWWLLKDLSLIHI